MPSLDEVQLKLLYGWPPVILLINIFMSYSILVLYHGFIGIKHSLKILKNCSQNWENPATNHLYIRVQIFSKCKIRGSHKGGHEEFCLLGYTAVLEINRRLRGILCSACLLLGSFLDPEDGSDMFHKKDLANFHLSTRRYIHEDRTLRFPNTVSFLLLFTSWSSVLMWMMLGSEATVRADSNVL